MRLTDYWAKETRIIEIDAPNGSLASAITGAGYQRFLSVSRDRRRCRAIIQRWPRLCEQVVCITTPRVIRQNNADALILHGWAALSLVLFRNIRHAHYVAIPGKFTPLVWMACALGVWQFLLGRLGWPRILDCTDRRVPNIPLLIFRVRQPRPYAAVRRFIPHALGTGTFLCRLQESRVRHAVLRWFEDLPHLPADEDLDLLVADEHLEQVRVMLDEGPGIQPIDVYSVTGLPGSDFRQMPYLPPYLAKELLDHATVHRGLCSVPSPREHFLSLAYHVLYHKGDCSGLPRRGNMNVRRVSTDHNYTAILRKLAAQLGIDPPITLEDLDEYLNTQGWRPSRDMLMRLARRNRWLRTLVVPSQHESGDDGLTVFLLREEAMHRGGIERAVQVIQQIGFQVIAERVFQPAHAQTVARLTRGGNWGQGPYKISAGPPVAAIVAYDPSPIPPPRDKMKQFPFVVNARLFSKSEIRSSFNSGYPKSQHCNVVHSSDNGSEAIEYLRITMPDAVSEVLGQVAALKNDGPQILPFQASFHGTLRRAA